MKIIESKKNESEEFIRSIQEEFKDTELLDCIFIGIFPDGSSDIYHTTMRTSEMVYQFEKAKVAMFDE